MAVWLVPQGSDAHMGSNDLANEPMMERANRYRKAAENTYRRWMRTIVRRVPPGARSAVGLLLIVGGVLGFLPILGFWMIPLGAAVIAVDVALIRRKARRNALVREPLLHRSAR